MTAEPRITLAVATLRFKNTNLCHIMAFPIIICTADSMFDSIFVALYIFHVNAMVHFDRFDLICIFKLVTHKLCFLFQ